MKKCELKSILEAEQIIGKIQKTLYDRNFPNLKKNLSLTDVLMTKFAEAKKNMADEDYLKQRLADRANS